MSDPERKPLLIMGTRPYALVFADVFENSKEFEIKGFIENEDPQKAGGKLENRPIYWVEDLEGLPEPHWAVCCLATTHRDRFVEQVAKQKLPFATLVHETAHVSKRTTIDVGCSIDVGVIVAGYSNIGPHVTIRRGATIGHHLNIGAFCTIQPGSNIASSCNIESYTYIGMGATVLEGLHIGTGSIIGAGAVVTRDVPAGSLVVGVPGRIVKKNIARK